ncbi:unnamed protein product [Urochloa decumbens]|uniref:Uncharacterized protein n=1 Tax=Urochloa decumbens TaxID=240449 RepID=A0ABC9B887_9POAL
MADLVLGLAKSAVEGTLIAAKSAIEEEEKLKKNIQRDLMLISDEFEMMHSFLVVSKERATDEMVKTLVRQVRNLALDVEDCIESVVVVDVIKSHGHWWRRLLSFSSCLRAVAAPQLDDAVNAIELLKSRVEAVGKRNERYRHIGDAGCCNSTEQTAMTTSRHQQAIADAAGILIEARDAKKKQSGPKDLIQLINRIDNILPLQMISLWGASGDLGVASIIKKTRDDPEICSKFSFRAWVKLTQPFNPHDFIRSLMAQFYRNCCREQGTSSTAVELLLKQADATIMALEGTRLAEEFSKQVMSDHRYLIFLEDLPSTVDWEAVRLYLPDKKNGSCVVVHTQHPEVASLVVGESNRVLELEHFSADHSVCVFFNEKRSSPRDLMELINMKEKDYGPTPLQVISVCGEIGDLEVEMESIIKKTCNDNPEICKKFQYRAWVKVMHPQLEPFNPREFFHCLLDQLCTNYCPRHGSAQDFLKLKGVKTMVTDDVLIKEFIKQVMSDQRYLVFLQDMASKDDWNAIREYLPDNGNGSCIFVHTQQPEVASSCVRQPHRKLELHSANHSLHVLFKEDEDEERAMKTKDAKEWLQKFPCVGRRADIESLSANDLGVQPVFGVAGVGKSYIVRHVYFNKVIDERNHFEKFGWVDVSHPFNIRDFAWSLLLDLHSGSLQHSSMLRFRDPIQECSDLLKEHACLIVIDGLQSTEEWDSIKAALAFEHDQNQSRIIVITIDESVATYCSDDWWNVEVLEIDDALELFRTTACRWRYYDPSPAEIMQARYILHKCGGLPKVIVAVADVIADPGRLQHINFMQLLETNPAFGGLRGLFSWVHSYFHSCPDSLKPCIFYMSIFPVNHTIRRRRLVRRWIAEGYSTDTKESTAEEKGEASFKNLRKMNMIQVPGSTNLSYMITLSSCQVNGFFREYIKSRSMEENLVFALEGHCSVNSQRTGRHLTIESTWDRDITVYQSLELSRLRSLTVFGKWESFLISDKMRILRVLDLEDSTSVTDGDLERMVKLLPRLKFLSLRGCQEVTCLPDSFGDGLKQLQTLDIRHTFIVKLPLSINKLHKLQHIRAGTTSVVSSMTLLEDADASSATVESLPPTPPAANNNLQVFRGFRRLPELCACWCQWFSHSAGSRNGGIEAPRGIGKMMALQNISAIDISVANGREILQELKNLTQLRKLGVSGLNQQNCKEFCSAISGHHPHLKSLSVWLDNKNQAGCLDDISTPPQRLHNLKLYGCVDKLPAWIKLLPNLSKLKLQVDMITQDEVDLLGHLPRLNTLCLYPKDFQYGELRFSGMQFFRELMLLEIACNSRLQAIRFEHSGVMPSLEVLKMSCYHVSSFMLLGVNALNNLKEVSLSGFYDDKVRQHLQRELQLNTKKVKPDLKVIRSRPHGRNVRLF